VFFDDASAAGTFTVTVDAASNCLSFDASGITNAARKMTLAQTTFSLSVFGSWTNPTTTFFAHTGTVGSIFFSSTSTGNIITTNGVTLNSGSTTAAIFIFGVGGGWTLGSALTSAGFGIYVRAGTFDTSSANNYAVTTTSLVVDAAGPETINLNASSVTLSSNLTFSNSTGLTLNAGTSTITCSSAAPTFAGGGKTFYNVTFSSTAAGNTTISGTNTFNGTLTQTSRSAVGIRTIVFVADQTINTLTLGSTNTSNKRILVFSSNLAVLRTLTVTTFTATTDVDFRDIQAAGTSVSVSNWNSAGTGRFGNCGNNGNKITFDTPKTVYWNLAAGGNWSDTAWALTTGSGAAVAANNFPLAQDTAIIQSDVATLASGNTITLDNNWNIGNINFSSRTTNTMTFATGAAVTSGIYGDFNIGSGVTITTTSGAFQLYKQGGPQTFTYSPTTPLLKGLNQNGPGGTVRINGNVTLDPTVTYTLAAGTLDLTNNGAGNYTLSTGVFSSSNSNTRSVTFGTGNITLTGSGTVWSTATSTNFSRTGTPTVNVSNNSATATTLLTSTLTEAQALDFNYTIGTYTLTDTTAVYRNLNFSGFAGTVLNIARTIYGNANFAVGPTYTAGAVSTTFAATSGTQQITTNSQTLDFSITQNNSGATLQLVDNLTMGSTRTFALTQGTLDLGTNNKTLSTGIFSSNNSNTRAISFGTSGLINITGVGGAPTNVFVMNTATNFTYTGTSKVTLSGAGTGGTSRQIIFQTGATESNALNFFVTAGSDQIIAQAFYFKNLDFTGFSGTVSDNSKNIYGNLILSPTMTYSNSTGITSFIASSGTQQLTTNGITLDAPVTQNNVGATLQLQDNLTIGSTRTFTHTGGTLDLNTKTATIGTFSSTGSGTRAISFGTTGKLAISGSSTSAFTASGSGLTTSGTGTISMTSASAKTFSGGDFSYPTLAQDGAGTLTITGSNTFYDMTNSVQPTTITFTAGTNTSVNNFSLSGTAGNLVTINSSVAGSQFTLTKI
jgi:hypothetical protein